MSAETGRPWTIFSDALADRFDASTQPGPRHDSAGYGDVSDPAAATGANVVPIRTALAYSSALYSAVNVSGQPSPSTIAVERGGVLGRCGGSQCAGLCGGLCSMLDQHAGHYARHAGHEHDDSGNGQPASAEEDPWRNTGGYITDGGPMPTGRYRTMTRVRGGHNSELRNVADGA